MFRAKQEVLRDKSLLSAGPLEACQLKAAAVDALRQSSDTLRRPVDSARDRAAEGPGDPGPIRGP